MPCRRCQGLMVIDHFIDMQNAGDKLWLSAWRCINCGDVVEPGIIQHRQEGQSQPKRSTRTASRSYEVIPVRI